MAHCNKVKGHVSSSRVPLNYDSGMRTRISLKRLTKNTQFGDISHARQRNYKQKWDEQTRQGALILMHKWHPWYMTLLQWANALK